MTNPVNMLPSHVLLAILDASHSGTSPTDEDVEKAVTGFLDHLATIQKAQKSKKWSERYLIDGVFGRSRKFNNEVEQQAYCRVHLRVALDELTALINDLRDQQTSALTFAAIKPLKETIRDFVFDLQGIVSFLQRKSKGYVYLHGGKNPTVHSWEVYVLAKGIAHQSAHWGQGPALDHKVAQISAIGVLRQALELRFTRLIAVYPTDKKGKSPKLRHGFHQDFIVANPNFFQAKGYNIADLRPMYDWCSEVVHQAEQPYAWQISWAIKLAGRLLAARPAQQNAAWSIANAVEIPDVLTMQDAFENHFLANYQHGEWQMAREQPEALTPNWKSHMAGTNPNFRSPNNRKPAWKSWLARILRLQGR